MHVFKDDIHEYYPRGFAHARRPAPPRRVISSVGQNSTVANVSDDGTAAVRIEYIHHIEGHEVHKLCIE